MSGLTFSVSGARAIPFAASPVIAFQVEARNSEPDQEIHSIALRCQIQIEAQRRSYSSEESKGLLDLFGEPDRWSQTVRPLLWTHVAANVPSFCGATGFELPVACSFDFNIGATKYFHAAHAGEIPLLFQFSGTVFRMTANEGLQISQIPWDRDARYRLPAGVWRDMMDAYYPHSAWLRLRRDAFDRLNEYKQSEGFATWEEALESLLPETAVRGAGS